MKKLNKLFATLFAVLGVQTLSAQTDVTSQYLTNAGFEDGTTNGWTVSISDTPYKNTDVKKSSDAGYNFGSSNPSEGTYYLATRRGWNGTNGKSSIEISQTVELPAGKYLISCDYKAAEWCSQTWATSPISMIVKDSKSTVIVQSEPYHLAKWLKNDDTKLSTYFTDADWTPLGVFFEIKETQSITFTTQASLWSDKRTDLNVDNYKLYEVSNASVEDIVDFSGLIANSKMETGSTNNNKWSDLGENTNTAMTGFSGKYMLEKWTDGNKGSLGDFTTAQTLPSLPNGKYRFSAYVNATVQSQKNEAAKTSAKGTYLYAGANETEVATLDGVPEKFSVDVVVTDNKLTLGLKTVSTTVNWIAWDNLTLEYLGVDLTELENNLSLAIANAGALSGKIPIKAYENLSQYVANNSNPSKTQEGLETAINNVNTAVDNAKALMSPYANVLTKIQECEGIWKNSVEYEDNARATFSEAIEKAKTDVEATETTDAISNVYNTLETARQTYVVEADPTNDTYFDYTFKITNSTVANGDGWTGARTNSGEQYTSAPDNTYWDSWNGSGQNIYQEIANLPSGLYTLKAAGRASTNCISAYIYLNDTKAEIDKAGNSGNDLGNGWRWYITEKTAVAGTAKVGFGCNTASEQWAGADDFHLYYYGFDVETAQSSVVSLVAKAEALVGKPMNKDVATTLNSAIAGADATKTTRNELNSMIDALNKAIEDAEASIAAYEKLAGYINMTAVFADVTTYQAKYNNGEYITDDVKSVRQELNVERYNAASLIFPNNIEVTGWEGSMGGKNTGGQHWNGTTTGNEATKYYDNNSWNGSAHSTTTNITLPAGNYVLKAALRSHESTTLKLTVLDETVNIEGKGDQGYGIDVNGKATFAEEANYANDDKGRGWEWEFVKFELTEKTTVTLKVECDYNGVYGWASFSDITLWMDDETYLTVYGKELDAPLAEAKALVDTKPMGTAENTALENAIALGEAEITTPAQLNGAIDALNTAVANANAWIAAYNEAKAPLVVALERFETELNDGVNGCKYNMVEDEDVWATLITEVGEAACTKDVTNDYYSFANAAEKLNNAIDEVHNWIRTNPTLNAKSATAVDMTDYYLVNASFDEGNTNGWEKTGSQTNNVAWSVTDGTFTATPSGSHYTGDAIWQKVNLAKGAYKLTVNLKAQEVAGHPSQVFVAGAAPSWNNNLSDLIASVKVTEFNKDIELSCIFNVTTDADVYIGFNQKSGNVAGTGIKGSYTIYDFTLTQAANQIITKDGVITVVGENEAADLAGISSDENIVKVDLTGATWNEASTLSIVNKNSLVYVTDDANLTANNIVKVGVDEEGNTTRVAKSIVLTEGYKFSAREAFTATALNYAREFSANNWLTVCLPFAYEIPEGVKVETLGAVDLDTKTFTFNEVTGTMEANKPYIIKNSSETAALFAELGDVTVEATPEAMTVEVTAEGSEHKAEFIGTYTAVKTDALMENGAYDILFFGSDGQLYFLSQGVTTKNVNIKPFRAYIRLPKDAINWSDGQQAIARHGGGTTDIEDAELTNDGASVIYDLMGRKVNTIEKGGMYIVNGKKVVIR